MISAKTRLLVLRVIVGAHPRIWAVSRILHLRRMFTQLSHTDWILYPDILSINKMDALPPGLNGAIPINIISGSHPSYDADWMEFSTSKLYTNVFVWNNDTGKVIIL